jgi:hypothetical protein
MGDIVFGFFWVGLLACLPFEWGIDWLYGTILRANIAMGTPTDSVYLSKAAIIKGLQVLVQFAQGMGLFWLLSWYTLDENMYAILLGFAIFCRWISPFTQFRPVHHWLWFLVGVYMANDWMLGILGLPIFVLGTLLAGAPFGGVLILCGAQAIGGIFGQGWFVMLHHGIILTVLVVAHLSKIMAYLEDGSHSLIQLYKNR